MILLNLYNDERFVSCDAQRHSLSPTNLCCVLTDGLIHKLAFEGGQMPLVQRIPKVGFKNIFSTTVAEVNVRDLARFDDGATVDVAALVTSGLVKGRFDVVKVLGDGALDRKLTVAAHRFSKGAKAKIEAAGGTVEIVPRRRVDGEPASE